MKHSQSSHTCNKQIKAMKQGNKCTLNYSGLNFDNYPYSLFTKGYALKCTRAKFSGLTNGKTIANVLIDYLHCVNLYKKYSHYTDTLWFHQIMFK